MTNSAPQAAEPEIDAAHLDKLVQELKPEEFQGYLLFEIHRRLWRYDKKLSKVKDLKLAELCIQRLIQSLQREK